MSKSQQFTESSIWGHWTHNAKGRRVLHPHLDADKCRRVHYNPKGEKQGKQS